MERQASATRVVIWAVSILSLLFAAPALAQSDDEEIVRIGGRLFAGGGNYRVDEDVSDNAFIGGGRVLVRGNYGENVYLAGGDAEFEGLVRGDLFMAGGTLDIAGGVGDDAYVAGGTVRQRTDSVIAGDAFLAGGTVEVNGTISGDLHAGAGTVRLNGEVAGNVEIEADRFLAGGTVEVNGTISGDLHAGAGTVRLNGEVAGNVEIEADRVILGAGARIGGTLTYRSDRELDLDPGAVVTGAITQLEPRVGRDFEFTGRTGIGSVGSLIALALMAALLHLVMPGIVGGAVDLLSERPLPSFGFGLAVAIGGPIAVVLLMITIIGIPVAVLLGLTIAVLTLAGSVVAGYWVGLRVRSFANTSLVDPGFWGRVAWTVAGFIVLAIVRWVPYVGEIAVGILYAVAVGALLLALWDRFRGPTPASPAI